MARRSFTEVPYQYGDGKYGVAIGQTRNGVEELVTLSGQMVWDEATGLWVPVTTSKRLPVDAQLSGRNVQPTKLTITENPLNAGGWSPEPAVLDVLASPGVAALEYVVSSDQPITCEWYSGDGSGSQPAGGAANRKLAITLSPSPVGGSQIIPAFRPPGISVRRTFRNSGTQAATFTRIYELRHHSPVLHPQNLRAVLAHQLAIRDTTEHTVDTDPNYLFPLSRIWLGGGKVPIYVRNGLDQALTVSVVLVIEGLINATLGTVSVPASSTKVVTNSDFAGIDVPSETIRLTLKCSTAPTTGTVSAYIDTLVGGSA